MESLYQDWQSDGLIVITLLVENLSSATPSQTDLAAWANQFGLTHPVVADPNWQISNRYLDGPGLPATHLIGSGSEVLLRSASSLSTQNLLDALP
jgi:hypothetical protein